MSVGFDNREPQRQGQQSSAQRSGPEGGAAPEWNAIKDDVSQIAGAAVEQGRQFIDSAKEQAAGYVDQRKDEAAESIQNLARFIKSSAEGIREAEFERRRSEAAGRGQRQRAQSSPGSRYAGGEL